MTAYRDALAVEILKVRRSKVPWIAWAGFSIAPIVGGLFMYILQDPERARQMGLIGQKAQLTAGTAEWPSLFALLLQAIGIGGAVVFALVTTWVFGREFVDRTVRTLLALPTSRGALVAAKATVVAIWCAAVTVWVFGLGLVAGAIVGIPGWSVEGAVSAAGTCVIVAALTIALQSTTALFACVGRGYLAPMGWALAMLALANILAVMGWGAWFPWSVPVLVTGAAGPDAEVATAWSYAVVALTAAAGLVGTFLWWERADHCG